MSNIWHDMNPSRITAEDFVAVIEIEKNSKKKYELDKETGMIILDRILYTSTHYPANYGFIPRTLSEDGDPLDVLVLCSQVLMPMSLVRCYPIGVFTMLDCGKLDEKIRAQFRDSCLFTRKKCDGCFAKYICSGGCSANNYHFNGDINDPYEITCEMMRKRIEDGMHILAERKRRKGEA